MSEELPKAARILLIRMSALGDVLFALETLASLKNERPDLRVDYLVDDRFAGLLQNHPQIDRLITFPRHSPTGLPGYFSRLRKRRYAALLDLHGILKSSMAVLAARADRKIGYAPPGAREGAQRFYHQAVQLPSPLPHRAERGYYLLRALGLQGEPASPVLSEVDSPANLWSEQGGARIVLHPGTSSFAAFKRWPAERFAELAGRISAMGHQVLISHGPGEEALARQVQAGAENSRLFNGGDGGLLSLAAGYREADLVVAADTGPLHIAASTGTKVIALFGPKDTSLYGPRGEGHRVLYHQVPCRPCTRRNCDSPQCILGLQVEAVAEVLMESLQG
ncbi:MAG: glycosyltransferase family 9 protein [Planctomycetota bacterium]|jgi:ADP-heptose:LPS heptosyltransferase